MQLQELKIDSFGVWQGVTFPLNERGVTVLYGPNEAGKSTLMRLVRGILYGFEPEDALTFDGAGRTRRRKGELQVLHSGEVYRLARAADPGTRGRLEINGRSVADTDRQIQSLVNQTSREVFQNIFAIGLQELQQLATLDEAGVAEHIYSLSLGADGKRLSQARAELEREFGSLADWQTGEGELSDLLARLAEVEQELEHRGRPAQQHHQLHAELRRHESEIGEHRARQSQIQHDLKGHEFLKRVYEPWQKEQDLLRRIQRLPGSELDREILDRFDAIELELSEVGDRKKQLIAEARSLQKQAEGIRTRPALEAHACAVQNLFEHSREMQAVERGEASSKPATSPEELRIEEICRKLGPQWNRQRLEQVQWDPKRLHEMLIQSAAYQKENERQARQVKRLKRLRKTLAAAEQEQQKLPASLRDKPVESTRRTLRQELLELEELRSLRMRRDHLRNHLAVLRRDNTHRITPGELPHWFWLVIGLYIMAGMGLIGGGIYAAIYGYEGIVSGGPTAWIVGACYVFLGLCTAGTARTMRRHYESVDGRPEVSRKERETLEHELHRVEQAINRIVRRYTPSHVNVTPPVGTQAAQAQADDQLMSRVRGQLAELDSLQATQQRCERLRAQMGTLRQKLKDRQRGLARSRREWLQLLSRMGLSEQLKVADAFAQLQLIQEAQQHFVGLHEERARHRARLQELEAYQQKVRDLAVKIEGSSIRHSDPYALLSGWARELEQLEERRRERSRLRRSAREKRREAARLDERIERLRRQRGMVLKQLGVSGPEEIAEKLAAWEERATLELELNKTRDELRRLAEAEPELAIVEDDLRRFELGRHQQSVTDLQEELALIDRELAERFQQLGTLKRELREMEDDRTLSSLRFDREQIRHQIEEAADRWMSLRAGTRLIDELRTRLEAERQPRTLQMASRYLQQLTNRAYSRIWNPLGESRLMVDNTQSASLSIEQLSSGTREQVFLAIRLAMIHLFSEQGTELPIILDDVTVNFDHQRTESAVETLMDIASEGQQILLFTCHQHLAQMFERRGIEPVYLLGHRTNLETQRSIA